MATLTALLSTTAGLVGAVAALVAALAGLVAGIVKWSRTGARLAKIEAAIADLVSKVGTLKKRVDRMTTQAQVNDKVESVRSCLLPEHANADELEELKAEVATMRANHEVEMRRLNYAFGQVENSVKLIVDGKVKFQ